MGTGVYVEPEYFVAGSLYDCIHRKAQQAIELRREMTKTGRKARREETEERKYLLRQEKKKQKHRGH